MTITYTKGWFRATKRPLAILSTEQARRAHAAGRLYTALIGDSAHPKAFIDIRLEVGHVGVHFLDERARVCLTYNFKVVHDGQMFLMGSMYHDFDGASDDPRRTTIFKFSQGGEVDLLEMTDGQQREGRARIDPAGNWEPVPQFGEYDGVLRLERPEPSTESDA